MPTTRRTLLRAGMLGVLGWSAFGGWERALAGATRVRLRAPLAAGDSVVVVVNLFGGNDGLNTVVPLRQYARYRELRPTIGWPRERLLPLAGYQQDFALNPGMGPLAELFRQGKVAIVNGVAWPQDAQGLFDHEASQQNLQTATTFGTAPPTPPSGWVGRFLDGVAAGALPRGIDFSSAPLLLSGVQSTPLSLYSIDGFGVFPSADFDDRYAAYQRLQAAPAAAGEAERNRTLRQQVVALSGTLQTINDRYATAAGITYPTSSLGGALRDCAALIAADEGVRGLAVGFGGFDTHSDQNDGPPDAAAYHEGLWRDVSDAVDAFQRDLSGHGLGRRVLTLVCSEFGRRAYENNDLGTDHGLAGVTLVIGDAVHGGIYGDYPDLREDRLVLDGNLDLTTDFRSVYATILARHLSVDPEPILGGAHPLLGFLT